MASILLNNTAIKCTHKFQRLLLLGITGQQNNSIIDQLHYTGCLKNAEYDLTSKHSVHIGSESLLQLNAKHQQ